jgi:hypothetical protein
VDYDLQRARDAIKSQNLPHQLAERLAAGW